MSEQRPNLLSGDQALARGALASGVRLVTSYPGSPSLGTIESLLGIARDHDIYVEWSANEKVALEMGIGASIAGRRVLVCAKSVGMNAMIDPLMALNLTPVKGGMVILLGDDPGAYGSQNDQDTRLIAPMLEMPMLEPATPSEGYAMMAAAFTASEEFNTPVIIRVTRSYAQRMESTAISEEPSREFNPGFTREPWRFVPVPGNAVAKHKELHARLERMATWIDGLPFHRSSGAGSQGVLAAGFVYQKLIDIIGTADQVGFRVLKAGCHYPLPKDLVSIFLKSCQQVLVLEENEPFLEERIKALAYDLGTHTNIYGKQSGHLPREGELYRWQIQRALSRFIPDFHPATSYQESTEAQEIPGKENHCAGAGYGQVLDALEAAAKTLGQKLVLCGDPGCLVTVAERLDAKFAIGSAVGVADGFSKAGAAERAVALFGDSAFFHSSIPAICNAVHNRSTIMMVLLDNQSTASTGHQPNPGNAKDAFGRNAPGLSMEQIARACGVQHIFPASTRGSKDSLMTAFKLALLTHELALVIVRIEPAQ